MTGECKDCANLKNCTKMIGIVWGFCRTDFQPKGQEKKNESRVELQ